MSANYIQVINTYTPDYVHIYIYILLFQTLKYALSCDCKKDFLDIAVSCKAVICCRLIQTIVYYVRKV